jgi:hypothetical protein
MTSLRIYRRAAFFEHETRSAPGWRGETAGKILFFPRLRAAPFSRIGLYQVRRDA